MYFEIYGYDDKRLCIVKANSKERAKEYAMTLDGFYSWHGKGYVKEVKVVDLTGSERNERF